MTKYTLRTSAALASLALLGACTTSGANGDDNAPVDAVPAGIAPIVDSATGTIAPGSRRPLDQESLDAEVRAIETAERAACLKREGWDGATADARRPDPMYEIVVTFPPWRVEDAAAFAFLAPQPAADLLANDTDLSITPAERAEIEATWKAREATSTALDDAAADPVFQAAIAACETNPTVTAWRELDVWEGGTGPWIESFTSDRGEAFRDDRMATAKATWVECVRERGVEPTAPESTEFWTFFEVEGQNGARIDEEQIELAVAVAECKETTGAAERVMEIWSEYEARTYLDYEAEILAHRDHVADIRAQVSEYWATH